MFYPERKEHLSPSAMKVFHDSLPSFIKTYFENDKIKETKSMEGGSKIHSLIEGGFLKVNMRFDHNEEEIKIPFKETGVYILGRPDSYGVEDGVAKFLDYKTSRDNSWTREKLNDDIKMELTAWLVWKKLGEPELVKGYIYWIGTEWNDETKEVVPSGDDFAIIGVTYTAQRLRDFEAVIEKTINDVNALYEKYLNKGTAELNEELARQYQELAFKIREEEARVIQPLKEELKNVGERIKEVMSLLDQETVKTDFGTFYFRKVKKFEYPETLPVSTDFGEFTLKQAEEIGLATSATKKHYQKVAEPKEVKVTLQFRAKRK